MAKKRFTDIEIWDREWYMELKPVHKCLMKYIFDKCDACGCWKPNWKLASLHIGEKVDLSDLNQLPKHQYEVLESGKIYIPDFIKFQYGKLSKKSPAHNPVFLAIENNRLSDRVFDRVSNTPKEEEVDIDKEEEVDKEEEKEREGVKKNEKFLVPEMQKIWKEYKPDYPNDKTKDFTALQAIAVFICENSGIDYRARGSTDNKNLYTFWGTISKFVSTHSFYRNYSLNQVEKHIQSITQEIQNGQSNSKNGKSGIGKVNGQQLHNALDRWREKQKPV